MAISEADRQRFERGAAAWPDLTLDLEAFAGWVAAREPPAGSDPADLFLAAACAARIDGAVAAFERRHRSDIAGALGKTALPRAMRDDITQEVLAKLFVGDRPRIASFTGRGKLRSWVRAVAVRAALDALRAERSDELAGAEPLLEALDDSGDDADLRWLKQRYREQVNRAFAGAFAALDRRQRAVLRHHYLGGLNIDRIGAMYNVHRVTAFRWLTRARAAVLDGAREALASELSSGEVSADGILRLVQSQIDVTIERLLESG